MRPVAFAHFATTGQSHAGWPLTLQRGSGSSPRYFHIATVACLTSSLAAMSTTPTGSHTPLPDAEGATELGVLVPSGLEDDAGAVGADTALGLALVAAVPEVVGVAGSGAGGAMGHGETVDKRSTEVN